MRQVRCLGTLGVQMPTTWHAEMWPVRRETPNRCARMPGSGVWEEREVQAPPGQVRQLRWRALSNVATVPLRAVGPRCDQEGSRKPATQDSGGEGKGKRGGRDGE